MLTGKSGSVSAKTSPSSMARDATGSSTVRLRVICWKSAYLALSVAVRPRIAEGKWRKKLEELVLLKQEHVNADKYEGKTIEQIRAELSGQLGENVEVKRFARFQVGAEA